jgi:hypothetical protein
MGDRRGAGRHQRSWLPESFAEDRGAEPPGRFWEAWVAPLALEPFGCVRALAAATGRPGADPRALWRRSLDGSRHRRCGPRRHVASMPPPMPYTSVVET